ncbi:flavin monoamine oxidase family protein [Sporobolomyces koalae]|uniref:flavin monoamine oxidase family protein n=1 Tax=Sporobolomyces koalae TaxID=500713 RepID=UPI00316D41A3
MSTDRYDVLIIGAGLAALQAARTLQTTCSTSLNIVMLEARDRVGGRALTHSSRVDLGCSMIHGYHEGNPAKPLLQELGMDVHIPKGAKGLVYGDQGPLTEAESSSLFASSTQMAYKPVPGTAENVSVASLLFPTLEHDERLVAIARTAEIGAGIELENTSAKWAGFEQGVGGTDAWPAGGYSEVVQNLVADYRSQGGQLKLNKQVTAMEDCEDHVKVTTRTGTTLTAKFVISTIPLSVLQKRPPNFTPSLPPAFLSAVERTLVGNLEKVVLSYDKPWWPAPETNGSYLLLPLSTASHPPSKSAQAPRPTNLRELFARTTIPVVNFYRLASDPHPTLLAYVGANAAKHLSNFSAEEIASNMHDYLVERLQDLQTSPTTPAPRYIDHAVTDWTRDPFSFGATSTPTTLTRSQDGTSSSPLDFVVLSRSTWGGRLGWAGEHTDLDNHGSVAGALISGKREGERVALLLEAAERNKD